MTAFRHPKILISALVLPLVLMFGSLQAKVTDEDLSGLKLAKETKYLKIYVRSGVDLSKYKTLHLSNMDVSLDEKWLHDYNRERKSLMYRLNEKDVAKMTERYAKKFQQTISRSLAQKEGMSLVDDIASADLKVEASIVNLRLYAPDKMTASNTTYLVRQVGEAELHTKMYDAKTGELLVAIIDEKETHEYSDLFQTNRVRNLSEFVRIYKAWAKNWFISLEQQS